MEVIILSIGGKMSLDGLICTNWLAVLCCFNWKLTTSTCVVSVLRHRYSCLCFKEL